MSATTPMAPARGGVIVYRGKTAMDAHSDHSLALPWGEEQLEVTLPSTWDVRGIFPAQASTPVADVGAAVTAALRSPSGTRPLAELARGCTGIVVVVDDGSRPTPIAEILPAVLDELPRPAPGSKAATVVAALGLHRAMTQDEARERLGDAVFGSVAFENHDCDDPRRLSELGRTGRGTQVFVNRTVAEADLVVCVGCIEPHVIAGFGGGAKMIVPGVAGRVTIGHNHALHCTPDTFDGVGRACDASPMRLDLEEAAALLRPPVFVVNAVLNGALDVIRVVAGDPVAAHRDGVRTSAAISAVRLARPVDVALTTSHPLDQDLRQGLKSLANTIRAVRPGGALVALLRAEEGVGVVGLARRKRSLPPRLVRRLAPALVHVVPRMPLGGMGEEDRFFLYFALQAMRRARMFLYAPTVPAEVRRGLPFATFVDSPDEALALARGVTGDHASVAVFPDGGATYAELQP